MSQEPRLTPEELENLVNDEFADASASDEDFDFPADPDEEDEAGELSDEETEDLTAADDDYGQSVTFSTE